MPWKQLNVGEKPNLIETQQSDSLRNNCSEYVSPSCKGKICTIVQLPWHLSGARAGQGSGPPLIGTFKGKILIDQMDLQKAQNEDSALQMVKSWKLTRIKLIPLFLTQYMKMYCNCTR